MLSYSDPTQINKNHPHTTHILLALLTFGCCWGWQVLVNVRWGKPELTAAHHLTGYWYWNPLWPTDLEWAGSDDPTHKEENRSFHIQGLINEGQVPDAPRVDPIGVLTLSCLVSTRVKSIQDRSFTHTHTICIYCIHHISYMQQS